MVQGGKGRDGSKGSIWGGVFEDEIRDGLRHDGRGVLSMANRGPGTNGRQFFITYGQQDHLDGVYTVFGRVVDGWAALDRMEAAEVGEKGRPRAGHEVVIERVTVHANPLA